MAIFTTNRTSLNEEDVENIIADESCSGDFGAAELVAESYYNDQAIFEAVLKRDVLSIVAEQDGSDSAKEKSSEADQNILQKMWAKISKLIDDIMAKIKGMADKFYKKMAEFGNKVVSKFLAKKKEKFKKANLSNMKVSGFKMFKLDTADRVSGKSLADAIRKEADLGMYDSKSKEDIQKMLEGSKKDIDQAVYGRILGKSGKLTTEEFKKEVHKSIWDEKETEKPFASNGNLKSDVLSILSNIGTESSRVMMVRNTKKELTKDLVAKKKAAKANLKSAKKAKDETAIAKAKAVSNTITALQRVAGTSMSTMMKEEKAIVKACWRLLKQGVKVAESKEGSGSSSDEKMLPAVKEGFDIDEDYLNALGEAAEYQAEMYLDCDGTSTPDSFEGNSSDDVDDLLGEDASYSFI